MKLRKEIKDAIILGHIYGYACWMMVLLCLKFTVALAGIVIPTVSTLLGFTHWFLIRDDKIPDAKQTPDNPDA